MPLVNRTQTFYAISQQLPNENTLLFEETAIHLTEKSKKRTTTRKSENLLCGNLACCFMTKQNKTISFDTWLRREIV